MPHDPLPGSAGWHVLRRTGIGGSDCGAVLGLMPFGRTPYDVWREKRRDAPPPAPETPEQRWGKLMEPVLRQEYANQTGRTVRSAGFLRHPQYPWMIGNPDGCAGDRGVELKLDRFGRGWGEAGTDEIPLPYAAQVQHYMTLRPDWEAVDVAVAIGGWDFRIYTVPRDPEIQRQIIDTEEEFWERHVIANEPPPPLVIADAQKRWGRLAGQGTLPATEALLDDIANMRALHGILANVNGRLNESKMRVMAALGAAAADALVHPHSGQILATWRLGKGIAAYTVSERAGSRKFLLK